MLFPKYNKGMSNSFLQCVANVCGLEIATLVKDYKYSVFGGGTVVVEGHKGIADYSSERVDFALRNALLRVNGTNLRIKCLDSGFAVVVGKVTSVEVRYEK